MTTTPPEAGRAPSRWRIFGPTLVLMVGVAVYSAYWYVVAGKVRTAIEDFAATPADNIVTSWSGLSISGYPYRIEAGFDAPSIRAPLAPEAWEWSAGRLSADFLPYNLRHVVLKIDGEQLLKYRDVSGAVPRSHVLRANAEGTWASYVDLPGAPFGRLAIDIDNVVAIRDGDRKAGRFAAKRLQLHTQPAETGAPPSPTAASYDVAIQADEVTAAPGDATRVLGDRIDLVAAQARVGNMPKSPRASLVEIGRQWLAEGGTLAVSDLAIKWGPLDLWAEGQLTLDARHRPEGRFDAAFANYQGLIEALRQAKIISDKDARLAVVGLGLFAQLQGDKSGRVHVPVVMKDGKLFLGPLVVSRLDPLF
jgi:hypothetical protein